MSTLAVVLSVITGLLFLGSGSSKTLGVPASGAERVRASFEHFGLPASLRVAVGVAEIAFAIGLFVAAAIDSTGLAIVAAGAGVVVLIGAVVTHARAGDDAKEYTPAVVFLVCCIGVIASAA